MRFLSAVTALGALALASGQVEAQVCYYEVPARTVYYYAAPVYKTTVCRTTVTYGTPVYVSSYPACYITPKPSKGKKPAASASAKGAVNADQALKDYEAAVKKKAEAAKEAKIRGIRARGKIKAQQELDKAQAEIDKINGKKPPKSRWERYQELLKKEESIGKDESEKKDSNKAVSKKKEDRKKNRK